MGIIAWIVFGFIVGLIARAVVPGKQGMGFILTTLLGVAGSLIGGLVAVGAVGRLGDRVPAVRVPGEPHRSDRAARDRGDGDGPRRRAV